MTANSSGEFTRREDGKADWFVPWRFSLLLGLLIIVTFPEVAAGLRAFCYSDAGQYGYPVAFFDRESFWRGEIPLWNPYNTCGIPFLAQWNTMTLYPPSLFYLILPMPWSFGVFCLGHLFLAGMGMYFLARRWTGSPLAGAVAGAVFAFNGLSWYGLMWANITAALGWMPWVVLAVERAWREGGRFLVLASLAAGMQWLSGGVEVILLTWLFLGVYWLAEFFRAKIPRRTMVLRMLAVGGLSAGLAAAQLLPFLDLLSHSQRGTRFGDSTLAAIPFTGLANYLVPLFHCERSAQGVPSFSGQVNWTNSYYLGVTTVALALVAAWRTRNLRIHVLAGLALFSVLMALGGRAWIYDWVKTLVPPLGFLRFPAKFLLLATFAIPLLAAYGLSRLLASPPDESRQEWRRIRWIAGVLTGLICVTIWFAVKHPLPKDDISGTVENALARAVFFALAGGCLVLLRRKQEIKSQRILQTCLILVLWFDVLTHAPDLSPTVASQVLQPDTIRQFFKWDGQLRPGVSRAMQTRDSMSQMFFMGSANAEIDINGRRLTLFENFNLLDHAAKIDGFYPMDLKDCLAVCEGVYLGTNPAVGLKDFLGISLTSDPANPVGWEARGSYLPMITVGQKLVFAGAAETFDALFRPEFEPTQTVFLPPEARPKIHATNGGKAEISAVTVSNRRLSFETEAGPTAVVVVVAQSYYHSWRAYVDGQATTIWPANYAFQALEVPAGKHQVSLVYQDDWFICGCLMSLVSVAGCAALWFYPRRGPAQSGNVMSELLKPIQPEVHE